MFCCDRLCGDRRFGWGWPLLGQAGTLISSCKSKEGRKDTDGQCCWQRRGQLWLGWSWRRDWDLRCGDRDSLERCEARSCRHFGLRRFRLRPLRCLDGQLAGGSVRIGIRRDDHLLTVRTRAMLAGGLQRNSQGDTARWTLELDHVGHGRFGENSLSVIGIFSTFSISTSPIGCKAQRWAR